MHGSELLDEIRRRIQSSGSKSVTDIRLSEYLGIRSPALNNYKDKDVTCRQVADLLEKAEKRAGGEVIKQTIVPIVEYLQLDAIETKLGRKMQLFFDYRRDGFAASLS